MPEIGLAGNFEAGVEAVFAAAVGRHVVAAPQGRLGVQTGAMPLPDRRLPALQSVFTAAQTVPVSFTLWHAPGHALAAREPPARRMDRSPAHRRRASVGRSPVKAAS